MLTLRTVKENRFYFLFLFQVVKTAKPKTTPSLA